MIELQILKIIQLHLHIKQLIIIISLKPNMKILNTKNSNKMLK